MKFFVKRHKHLLALILIFIVSELIVNPLGNFPLVDDWSFAQSVLYFDRTGTINIGNFPSMSLYTQVIWGYWFTHLFGFSFMVLRISTFVSAIAGLAFLNKLLVQISGNRNIGFIGSLVILFNPMVFNLTNTFMTDVNFNTLVILCCYLLYNYIRSGRFGYYFFFLVCSVAITMLRQYGIIFPACFVLTCFFIKERRILNFCLSFFALGLTYYLLKHYEAYLETVIPKDSTYKFSGNIHLLARAFWETTYATFVDRRKEILIHLLVYPMPVAVIFLPSLLKQMKLWLVALILPLNILLIYLLFSSEGYNSGTIFSHMIIGPETFCESFKGARHNVYPDFEVFLFWVKWVFSLITLFVLSLGLVCVFTKRKAGWLLKPELIFFILLVFTYTFMIVITESYFDRYHIPLITLAVILFAYLSKFNTAQVWLSLAPLVFWAYISVFGTKDYMELHRQTWKAYWFLRKDLNIPRERINGGFEVNCWNEGDGMGWRDFFNNDNFDYLIQFNPDTHFRVFKTYGFQRYFPYKKDKIYIFAKQPAGKK